MERWGSCPTEVYVETNLKENGRASLENQCQQSSIPHARHPARHTVAETLVWRNPYQGCREFDRRCRMTKKSTPPPQAPIIVYQTEEGLIRVDVRQMSAWKPIRFGSIKVSWPSYSIPASKTLVSMCAMSSLRVVGGGYLSDFDREIRRLEGKK